MSVGSKIRVLIADDSAFMRKVLLSILSAEPQLEVVGEARDGRDAVEKADALRPDVITMDINMPHVDGLQATELIMATNPRPIVIVSSESREGAAITLKALELGAIDFVAKPSSGIDLDMNSVRDELVRKVKIASKVRVVRTATRSKLQAEIASSAPRTEPASPFVAQVADELAAQAAVGSVAIPSNGNGNGSSNQLSARVGGARFPLVVIAASTGGPATLMKLMPAFPVNFPGAIVLVQHMPATFTSQFSQQLADVCAIKVKEAESGEMLLPGSMYVCPGSHHLRITTGGRITLDDGPRINNYRPCADVTLESAAQYAGAQGISVVLTGMGNDGSCGVQATKEYGGYVIAQDEATSVIFGMPAEAIKTGVVDQVLPLEHIYAAVEKRVMYVQGAAKVGAL